jgi:hypothetical protein
MTDRQEYWSIVSGWLLVVMAKGEGLEAERSKVKGKDSWQVPGFKGRDMNSIDHSPLTIHHSPFINPQLTTNHQQHTTNNPQPTN